MVFSQWKKTTLSGNKDLFDVHVIGSFAYIVGYGSAVYKSVDSGKTWSSLVLTIPTNLNACYFSNKDTGFVIGENARIQKTNNGGSSWTQKYVRTAAYGHDIQFLGNQGIAVGKDMLAVSSDNLGETWTVDTTIQINKKLNSVCILPNGMCWAVGDSGYILSKHISRKAWTIIKHPSIINFNHISNIGNENLIICGGMPDTAQVGKHLNIFLFSSDSGKTWSSTSIQELKTINTAWFFTNDTGYMAGSNGLISKVYQPFTTRGLQIPGTASALHKIFFDGKNGIIVGDGGVVLRTTNGGGPGLDINNIESSNFQIYPNPSNGVFYINSELEIASIEIYNSIGMKIDFEYNYANNELIIPKNGLYTICFQLKNGNSIKSSVVVIQ